MLLLLYLQRLGSPAFEVSFELFVNALLVHDLNSVIRLKIVIRGQHKLLGLFFRHRTRGVSHLDSSAAVKFLDPLTLITMV